VVSHDRRARRAASTLPPTTTRTEAPIEAQTTPAATLLARIEAFGLSEPDDPLGFESRLADDSGWTLGHALVVAEEYRRFLVLTQVAGHAVSPSHDVDEAWHLHLTRTAHYERFCHEVFGRFLHHEPARGGSSEDKRHRDMYAATLKAYRAAFDQSAPALIWPRPGTRVDARQAAAPTWQVPAALLPGHRLALAAVAFALAFGLFLCVTDFLRPLQLIPPGPFLLAALALTIALGWLGLHREAAPSAGTGRDALEPYEAAWYSGGARRMAMTAIATLVERGTLRHVPMPADPRAARPMIAVDRTVAPQPRHPAEAACLRAATDAGLRFADACGAMQPLADQVERRLGAAGLANAVTALPLRRAQVLVAVVALLVIEFERIFHAAGGGYPVGLLAVLSLLAVALVLALCRRPLRANARAEVVLKRLRLRAGAFKKTPPIGAALGLGVALMGTAAFAGDERFTGLEYQLDGWSSGAPGLARKPVRDGDSNCSSCSSCGSSDGGGGSSSDGGGGSSCGSSCGGGD
jgi:uncharacterized protein (TIGR04222 family)